MVCESVSAFEMLDQGNIMNVGVWKKRTSLIWRKKERKFMA
jgi:hypothetical protein